MAVDVDVDVDVDVVYDGAAAVERLAVHDYDVLVLDRDLPEIHGDLVCGELVARGSRQMQPGAAGDAARCGHM